MRTKLHLHCTQFGEIIFKVRKAHEASITHCWACKDFRNLMRYPSLSLANGDFGALRSGAVVGGYGIYMAYALMSSGHLPLMMPMLLMAFLGEGCVARVAWSEKRLKAENVQSLALSIPKTLLSLNTRQHCDFYATPPCSDFFRDFSAASDTCAV